MWRFLPPGDTWCDQFGVAARRKDGEDQGEQKRRPDGPSDLRPDLSDQRVDTGSYDVADDEEKQQPLADTAL
jgi:hypothetical protein